VKMSTETPAQPVPYPPGFRYELPLHVHIRRPESSAYPREDGRERASVRFRVETFFVEAGNFNLRLTVLLEEMTFCTLVRKASPLATITRPAR
jgi:hypothetical protein